MPTGFRLPMVLPCAGLAITLGVNLTAGIAAESPCPAPIATCGFPAPARHPETIATYFHTSGAVTLSTYDAECAAPIATCIQPAAYIAPLPVTRLSWRTERQPALSEVLQRWSAASNTHATWTATEKNWLARRHQPWLSAVALDAVVRLASSVKAADLANDFTWTQEFTEDDVTILRAVPTDETQRLFCPQLRVELDAVSHALTAIDVADRAGTWRPIDLPWAVLPKPSRGVDAIVLTSNQIEIELTGSVTITELAEVPPSPVSAPTIRFAADRVEFNAPR
ncbi:MAG: hypothetical protein Q8K78_12760 [Planctomycetaceae bacterium]|nr:hypothetical protein [Planctomycetaceae bacterium]